MGTEPHLCTVVKTLQSLTLHNIAYDDEKRDLVSGVRDNNEKSFYAWGNLHTFPLLFQNLHSSHS